MTDQRGLFIVTEGGDGSGKGTQHRLLVERLHAMGIPLHEADFPQYDKPSAMLVKRYLNNEFGEATKVDPYLASLPFALDRMAAKDEINSALSQGKVVLANRFTGSNMAHQGAKMQKNERKQFFDWLDDLEFNIMGIPKPDLNLILHVPAEIAQKRVLGKSARSYTDKKLDGHEADLDHLKSAEATYFQLAEMFPDNFKLISCVVDGYELNEQEVHAAVWDAVKDELPARRK